jgi:hypothetical protein
MPTTTSGIYKNIKQPLLVINHFSSAWIQKTRPLYSSWWLIFNFSFYFPLMHAWHIKKVDYISKCKEENKTNNSLSLASSYMFKISILTYMIISQVERQSIWLYKGIQFALAHNNCCLFSCACMEIFLLKTHKCSTRQFTY